ncbi:unnamed protein product [Spirodela intermedia]|uniref:Uncharacterized protein n=1 Tax=Spirodela intermedia TaxID=51605 RepID=A0A7I8IE77_SPIIN|nr:unnamed protein product [Spirodela intermedia]CAA6655685.1 unnamed protein product [Spirodela intermedia]
MGFRLCQRSDFPLFCTRKESKWMTTIGQYIEINLCLDHCHRYLIK